MTTIETRIYVADLAAYNNAKLHGVWIDMTDDLDDIKDQIHSMLARSPECSAEEFAIHDFEGFFEYRVDEWDSLEQLKRVTDAIEMHGPAVTALISDYDDFEEAFENAYCGVYESLEDYVESLYNDCYDIPEHLANYIDYAAIARDFDANGYYTYHINGECHVFQPY